jgi:hypothetical protein
MRTTRYLFPAALAIVALAALSPACGPKPDPERPRARPEGPREPERREADRPRERPDIEVEGLRGTIDVEAVEKKFAEKTSELAACRAPYRRLAYVSGELKLFFKIGLDGAPTVVVLESSTLGNHAAEACVVGVARALRFPKPKGGVAEVRYGLSLGGGGMEPKAWESTKVSSAVGPKLTTVTSCRQGGVPRRFTATWYVLPDGKVASVGVAAEESLPAGFGLCVAKAISAIKMPDPLGEVAKVAYEF